MIKIGILINIFIVIINLLSFKFWKHKSLYDCLWDGILKDRYYSDEEKHMALTALNSIDENILCIVLIVSVFLPYLWVLLLLQKLYRRIK